MQTAPIAPNAADGASPSTSRTREGAAGVAAGKIGRRPAPDVGTDRAAVADGAEHPAIAARTDADLALLLRLGRASDPYRTWPTFSTGRSTAKRSPSEPPR